MTMSDGADLNFYFDPVCPFAWMTSKWVRMVAQQRDYSVDWRFISLRIINADVDYDAHFPPGYEAGHTAGLRLLRVAARVRANMAAPRWDRSTRQSHAIFDTPIDTAATGSAPGTRAFLQPILRNVGLPSDVADALDADESFDAELRAETDEALSLTGKDVGTPILHFRPPTGTAFFGPVINRLPSSQDAGQLWDHVVGLASFPGFTELKRSLREQPQLASFGVDIHSAGIQEDWHGGSRRTKDQRGQASL